jgi:hypothetical protein
MAMLERAAVAELSRASRDPALHRAPVARVGVAQLLVLVLALAWVGAAPAVVLNGGPAALLVSFPVGYGEVRDGGTIEMRRIDGSRFTLVAHRESGRWWLDTVDPDWDDDSSPWGRPTQLADPDVAAAHAVGMLCVVPFLLALAALVWARGGRLRRWLARTHVVRARVRNADLTSHVADARLPEGTEMALAVDGTIVRLRHALRVASAPRRPSDDAWVEGSVVSARAWARDGGYRAAASAPPPDAQWIAGPPEDGLIAARLADIERAVLWGTTGVPLLAAIASALL